MKRQVAAASLAVVAVLTMNACGGSGDSRAKACPAGFEHDKDGACVAPDESGTSASVNTAAPFTAPPTTPPTAITTLAEACAKIHAGASPGGGGTAALVPVLPQLRAVFAGVPSDIGGNVVVPGLDDGT